MENSASSANSFNHSYNQIEGPLCHCNRSTIMSKSWTDDNPGRRFYKCDIHGFFIWADKEKPHGWQKVSLLEARDQIRRQKTKIKELQESLRAASQQNLTGVVLDSTTLVKSEVFEKIAEEKKKLQNELITFKEREKLLRQFVVISWGGFIVVTAMILVIVKN